jgi:hypothetical protein
MSTPINIIEDGSGRVTVDNTDPTIHFDTDPLIKWTNTLNFKVRWNFPGAPSIFVENEVTHDIDPGGFMTRTVNRTTPVRGNRTYSVAPVPTPPPAGGGSYTNVGPPDQPAPGLDIEP